MERLVAAVAKLERRESRLLTGTEGGREWQPGCLLERDPMYLVHDTDLNYFVFLDDDPRPAGFTGEVQEGVSLEADEVGISEWSHGRARPEHVLSVADDDPRASRYFATKPGAGFPRRRATMFGTRRGHITNW